MSSVALTEHKRENDTLIKTKVRFPEKPHEKFLIARMQTYSVYLISDFVSLVCSLQCGNAMWLWNLEWQLKCSKMTGKLAFISGYRAFRYLSSTLFKRKVAIV
jgi:hypothetical protein